MTIDPEAVAKKVLEAMARAREATLAVSAAKSGSPESRAAVRASRLADEEPGKLRNILIAEFARRRGWRRTYSDWAARKVLFGNEQRCWPHLDHCYSFQDRGLDRGTILASLPYDCDEEEDRAFAKRACLTVEHVPADVYPSWWYPGSTTLTLWRKGVFGLPEPAPSAPAKRAVLFHKPGDDTTGVARLAFRILQDAGVQICLRHGGLYRPITQPIDDTTITNLRAVTSTYLKDVLSQHIEWRRPGEPGKAPVPINTPRMVVSHLLHCADDLLVVDQEAA